MADKTGYIGRNPGDSSVAIARQTFTPTSNTTEFSFTSGYTVGLCDVYLNGVKLINGTDYEASSGSTVGLTSTATSGDVVEIVAYKAFNLGNVTDANGNFTVGSQLSVGSTATLSGVTTCEGDLYVGGDLYVLDDIVYDEVSGRNIYISGIATVGSATTIDGSGINVTGVITATAFVGDGSRITGVIAQGIGVSVSDENTAVGVAATINFGKYLDVSPISAGIVTVSVPNLVGTAQTALTLDSGYAVGLASNAYTADYATNAGVATNALNADACSGNAETATLASGIVTTFEIKSMFPITTTDKFYGDGSQLTNIVATGSGIGIRNDNTLVGTAQTVNFGLSLDTIISSSGVATVTVQKVPHADICGVASYSDKCGVATFADNAGIASNALNANFAQTASFSTLTGAAETSKSLYTEFQGTFKPLPVTIGGKTVNHRYNGIGSDKSINIQGYNSPCLLYTSPSPRDVEECRMPASA